MIEREHYRPEWTQWHRERGWRMPRGSALGTVYQRIASIVLLGPPIESAYTFAARFIENGTNRALTGKRDGRGDVHVRAHRALGVVLDIAVHDNPNLSVTIDTSRGVDALIEQLTIAARMAWPDELRALE